MRANMSESVTEWAVEYRRRGFAVCRLQSGEKRPTYKEWTLSSLSPEDFGPDDSIGIMAGRLSGDLVCVDIDCMEALAEADHFLPATAMEEGRPGKPRSHRWFRVVDIPTDCTAPCECAGGVGGPRTTRFRRGRGPNQTVVEVLGTGAQAAVPASLWTSRDGTRRERRLWHAFGEPAVVGYLELLTAVAKLAEKFGGRNGRWEERTRPPTPRSSRKREVVAPDPLPLPEGEVVEKARSYLRKMSPAVEGQGGDRQTFIAACRLVCDFDLSVEDALPLLLEWNERCAPPWSVEALVHKLETADALDGPRGAKLRRRSRTIEVNLRPGDHEVLLGVDCVVEGASYVNLRPDLWAALVKQGHAFRLAEELNVIDWAGKVVTLAPPSNVASSKKVVFDEYRLAKLLRERDADVQGLRIVSPTGKRLPYAQADEAEAVQVSVPPSTFGEAKAAAQAASEKAREQESVRRSLPRN